jgi:hypothetical protein
VKILRSRLLEIAELLDWADQCARAYGCTCAWVDGEPSVAQYRALEERAHAGGCPMRENIKAHRRVRRALDRLQDELRDSQRRRRARTRKVTG